MIFGMGRNDAGQIRVLGFDHRADEVALKQRAAYVSPDLNFQVWGRVGKAIRFVRGFFPGWDDNYCAELMKGFYTYYLQGKTAREALGKAQQDMRQKYKPYYWAAFVLIE